MAGGRLSLDLQNLYFNKRSITINLKSGDGLALFLKLAMRSNVVVKNFRKDVNRRLAFGEGGCLCSF